MEEPSTVTRRCREDRGESSGPSCAAWHGLLPALSLPAADEALSTDLTWENTKILIRNNESGK